MIIWNSIFKPIGIFLIWINKYYIIIITCICYVSVIIKISYYKTNSFSMYLFKILFIISVLYMDLI